MTQAVHRRPQGAELFAGGLMVFAAVMLIIGGILDIFRGAMAIAKDDIYITTTNYAFAYDISGWGWIHLVLGAIAVAVGFGLFRGALWARITGVGIAGLLVISNFLFLPYYPIWSIVLIAINGFIIWALCVARPETVR